jgi:hypothetical protein
MVSSLGFQFWNFELEVSGILGHMDLGLKIAFEDL